MNKQDNGIKKLNKWIYLAIGIFTIFGILIGAVTGMAIKSAKIDEAYTCAKANEQSIHDLREIMIRIDENIKYVRKEIEDMK